MEEKVENLASQNNPITREDFLLLVDMVRDIQKQQIKAEENRQQDKKEWQQAREEDRREMKHGFESLRAEMKELENNLRTEMREGFSRLDHKIDKGLDREAHEREKMEEKLEKVYESRNNVKVQFTGIWAMSSVFIALFASLISVTIVKAFFH